MLPPNYMFSYGLFMSPNARENTFGRNMAVTSAFLGGWVRQVGTYCAYILPKPGSQVEGVIIHDVKYQDWIALDNIEARYNRILIMLDGKECGVYVPKPSNAGIFDTNPVLKRDSKLWLNLRKRLA